MNKEIPKVSQSEIEALVKENIRDLQSDSQRGNINNPLATVSSAWKHAPRELISLCDMIPFLAPKFFHAWERLEAQQKQARDWRQQYGEEVSANAIHKRELINAILPVEECCEALEMENSLFLIRQFKTRLHHPANVLAAVVESEILRIRQTIWKEFSVRQFAFIPKAQFFEQDDLFGEPGKPFKPLASDAINAEIKAVGNCLAADLNTAAVFHLMRVAEHGLHALANYLGVKPPKPYPLEFSEWCEVIKAVDTELKSRAAKTQQMPRGSIKDQDSVFYSGLLTDLDFFNYFKDAYRNPVSHLRGNYDADRARVAFNEVGDFMRRLAPQVPLM